MFFSHFSPRGPAGERVFVLLASTAVSSCEASTILEEPLGRSGEKLLSERKIEPTSMRGASDDLPSVLSMVLYVCLWVWRCHGNEQGNYNYGSSSNAGGHAPLLGQDARNAGNMPQSLTVYQPNNGTPPAPASAAGTPGIRYGTTHNASNNPNARQPRTFRTRSG